MSFVRYLLGVAIFVCLLSSVQCGNIIIFHPLYAGSHAMILRTFGEYLSSRGHSVTQIRFNDRNPSPPSYRNSNVTVIDLPIHPYTDTECNDYINDDGEIDINIVATKLLWRDGESIYGLPNDIFCVTRAHCHTLFYAHHSKLKRLFKTTSFDLAIVDLIGNECGLAMAKSLGIPVVGFWMFSYSGGESLRSPVFNPPSSVPMFLSGLPPSKMNFFERTYNFVVYLTHRALLFIQESIADEFIGQRYPSLPSVQDMLFDLDFLFIHTNFLVDGPKLLAPNSKYVGGLHLRPTRNLSKDLKGFVEGAESGVILFSLGFTGYSPANVPPPFINDLMKVFSELRDFRVVMRFDDDCIKAPIPENVLVLKWLPQQDLLAHSKVKLFINHGGMGGIQESVYHGVPMVIIPIFGDQNDNAARIQYFGLGLQIIKSRLSYDNLRHTIRQVLFDEKYTIKARYYMNLWRDEWASSKEEAAYWIELLLKYRHLDHLKIQGSKLSGIKYFNIDVIAFLMTAFILSNLGLGYFIYVFFGRFFFIYDTLEKRKVN